MFAICQQAKKGIFVETHTSRWQHQCVSSFGEHSKASPLSYLSLYISQRHSFIQISEKCKSHHDHHHTHCSGHTGVGELELDSACSLEAPPCFTCNLLWEMAMFFVWSFCFCFCFCRVCIVLTFCAVARSRVWTHLMQREEYVSQSIIWGYRWIKRGLWGEMVSSFVTLLLFSRQSGLCKLLLLKTRSCCSLFSCF